MCGANRDREAGILLDPRLLLMQRLGVGMVMTTIDDFMLV